MYLGIFYLLSWIIASLKAINVKSICIYCCSFRQCTSTNRLMIDVAKSNFSMFCFFEAQRDMPRPIREPINQPLERRSSIKEDAIKESIRAHQENKENSQPVEKKDVEKKDGEKKM